MRHADLSLSVSQRKPACVLDPSLLLGQAQGPALAMRLARVFEPWLTRSFWQTLDSSELLLRRQARLAAAGELGAARHVDEQALAGWCALRERTDAGAWTLRWVGDSWAESQLGGEADEDLVERYEHLAAALLARLPADEPAGGWTQGLDPVAGALDALALSAALDGAMVLTAGAGPQRPAWAVLAAERAGLATQGRDELPEDSLFDAEQALVREALARAGLAPLLHRLGQAPLHWQLAVLHVHVDPPAADPSDMDDTLALPDPWEQARGWWYPL